ncbi:cobalamin biosynthesis protein CobW [Pseudomonas sp. PDM16]|uniref:CobW family GTP-binding protein n=1 Tax=Pseudomonas sp. PDM16 TaxID=2769292 RepID=UPI0017835A6E|nr:CobW family GTP-binding protein [Pseudomonas sp. PDM16]MBD9413326.1 cobalamin biosynthesis protein CobW [Pseudomonas sp. PDM16]
MHTNIPTHVIAGPLGAGKTSLIRHLLAQKPTDERWAVLINEFGQIGLDQALLTTGQDGVALAEIPGGCLCCVNGVPFQVGLSRLLRRARPDRLLIEPSGLGHPTELVRQLQAAPWSEVLALQPLVLVLDASAMASGLPLAESQQAVLALADLLVLNRGELLGSEARKRLQAQLPKSTLHWAHESELDFADLPGGASVARAAGTGQILPEGREPLAQVWSEPRRPICQVQAQADGWSIGWRFHPGQVFDLARIQGWLARLPWRRAKMVLHSDAGWYSANLLEDGVPLWRVSEWRRDSRLELIFSTPQVADALTASLAACQANQV